MSPMLPNAPPRALTNALPNALTVSRIALTPIICVLIALDGAATAWAALVLWIVACGTDFLDGWLARRYNLISGFGRLFDPIADKLLVGLVLLVLVGVDRLPGAHIIPAAVILAREFLISGLREHLAELNVALPVSRLAKWKTTVQMVAMTFLVIGPFAPSLGPIGALDVGIWGLWIAAGLTAVTGWDYLRGSWRHVTASRPERPGTVDRADPAHGTVDRADPAHGTVDRANPARGTVDRADPARGTVDRADPARGTGSRD
jgi:cardiolipin synthase (CMP-forming)